MRLQGSPAVPFLKAAAALRFQNSALLSVATRHGLGLDDAAGPEIRTAPMSKPPSILVFDSGVGGLTVFREIVRVRPDASYVYLADDAGFPYGNQPEQALIARIVDVIGAGIAKHAPDLIVIACNTASTLALSELRTRFSVPFVGTVPAIKPACAQSRSKRVAVLGTQATVSREYTKALIRE